MKKVASIPNDSRAGVARFLTLCLLVTPMLLSTGCFSGILRADFNEYAGTPSDGQLNGSIPGEPDGDSIQNADDVDVVVDEAIDGKSVRIQGQIELLPTSHSTPDEYLIDWVGSRLLLDNSGISIVSILDNDGDAALILEFDGLTDELRVLSGSPAVDGIPLSDLVHVIEMTIDMTGEGSIDFKYQEFGEEPEQLDNLEFLDPEFDEFGSADFQGSSNATYYMNDLTVITNSDRDRRRSP